MQGAAKVENVTEQFFTRISGDGKETVQLLYHPGLLEYDGEEVIVYEPLIRKLNQEEEEVFLLWDRTKCSGMSKKEFFEQSSCPYLYGRTGRGSRCYLPLRRAVKDIMVRGRIGVRYKVRHV